MTPVRPPAAPAAFQPLVSQPAYGRVSAAIEARIADRSLRPGDRLPSETELARQFAVHRSTVREALRRLESTGLVARDAGGKKLFVSRPDQAETASRLSQALALHEVSVRELWEAMLAIAPRTAALAATRSSPAQAARLRTVLLADPARASAVRVVAGAVAFFRTLAEISGNRVLLLAHGPILELLAPSLRRIVDHVPQARNRIATAQRILTEAVERGDSADAESWMQRHVQDFRRGYELSGIALDTPAA
jgi:DNA-binding FadR family transcriptional regulator